MDDGVAEIPVRQLPPPAPETDTDGKERLIIEASRRKDVAAIISLATSADGLLNDDLRKLAWPILLGLNENAETGALRHCSIWKSLPRHRDEDQVALDVDRSFVYYPQNVSKDTIDQKKIELSDIIVETLRTYPYLCYFQGYHDIVQVFLLVLGRDLAVDAVAYFSLLRIRDFMLPSLAAATTQLELLPALLRTADRELYDCLSGTRPYFALSATLTLYAHEIERYADIARIFDFMLAQDAVVPLYFFAQIILSRKTELLQIPADEPEMLHFTLSKLPVPLDLEGLMGRALDLYAKHPPRNLPFRAWGAVSACSVLKTTGRPGPAADGSTPAQSLARVETLFDRQVAQLRWKERRARARAAAWHYRRPAGRVVLAILVGGLSIWLRRRHEDEIRGLLGSLSVTIGRFRGAW